MFSCPAAEYYWSSRVLVLIGSDVIYSIIDHDPDISVGIVFADFGPGVCFF